MNGPINWAAAGAAAPSDVASLADWGIGVEEFASICSLLSRPTDSWIFPGKAVPAVCACARLICVRLMATAAARMRRDMLTSSPTDAEEEEQPAHGTSGSV